MVVSPGSRVIVARSRLRGELAELGLARSEAAHEPEDHFAGLLDVMRHLILLGSDDAALQKQQAFFGRYIAPACTRFCSAISENANLPFAEVVTA